MKPHFDLMTAFIQAQIRPPTAIKWFLFILESLEQGTPSVKLWYSDDVD